MNGELLGMSFLVAIVLFFIFFLILKIRVHLVIGHISHFINTFSRRTHMHVDRSYQETKVRTYQEILDHLTEQTYKDCYLREAKLTRQSKVTQETEDVEANTDEANGEDEWKVAIEKHRERAEELRAQAEAELEIADGVALAFDNRYKSKITTKPDQYERMPFAKKIRGALQIEEGIKIIVDRSFYQTQYYQFGSQDPDFEAIARFVMDENDVFDTVFKTMHIDTANRIVKRTPHSLIMLGITGTFCGFYVSLGNTDSMMQGVALALTSSLLAIPLALVSDYINTIFPDDEISDISTNRYAQTLRYIWKDAKALYDSKKRGRRRGDNQQLESAV